MIVWAVRANPYIKAPKMQLFLHFFTIFPAIKLRFSSFDRMPRDFVSSVPGCSCSCSCRLQLQPVQYIILASLKFRSSRLPIGSWMGPGNEDFYPSRRWLPQILGSLPAKPSPGTRQLLTAPDSSWQLLVAPGKLMDSS